MNRIRLLVLALFFAVPLATLPGCGGATTSAPAFNPKDMYKNQDKMKEQMLKNKPEGETPKKTE